MTNYIYGMEKEGIDYVGSETCQKYYRCAYMAKAKNKIKISMIGTNASDVTGSMTHTLSIIKAGIYQGGSLKERIQYQ